MYNMGEASHVLALLNYSQMITLSKMYFSFFFLVKS